VTIVTQAKIKTAREKRKDTINLFNHSVQYWPTLGGRASLCYKRFKRVTRIRLQT